LLQSEPFPKLVSRYKSLTNLQLYHVAFSNNHVKGKLELLENFTESLEIIEGNLEVAKPEDDKSFLRVPFVEALTVSRVGSRHPSQQCTPILLVLQRLAFEAQGMHLSDSRALVDLVRSRWTP
jgi:hypothetical protein